MNINQLKEEAAKLGYNLVKNPEHKSEVKISFDGPPASGKTVLANLIVEVLNKFDIKADFEIKSLYNVSDDIIVELTENDRITIVNKTKEIKNV